MITIHNWFSASVSRHVYLYLHNVFVAVIIILHITSYLKIRCSQGNSTSGPLAHEVERPRYILIGGRDVIWSMPVVLSISVSLSPSLLIFPLVLVYDLVPFCNGFLRDFYTDNGFLYADSCCICSHCGGFVCSVVVVLGGRGCYFCH